MRRVNITYSVGEEELGKALADLLQGTHEYISGIPNEIDETIEELKLNHFKTSLEKLVEMRDRLAMTDFRLHDIMSMIAGYESALQEQNTNNKTDSTDPQASNLPATMQGFNSRLQQVKENLAKLGMEVPEDKLKSMLEAADDSAS